MAPRLAGLLETKDFNTLAGRRAAKGLPASASVGGKFPFAYGRTRTKASRANEKARPNQIIAHENLDFQSRTYVIPPIDEAEVQLGRLSGRLDRGPVKYYNELYCHTAQCVRESSERNRPHRGNNIYKCR
jgi:hypothetical protein